MKLLKLFLASLARGVKGYEKSFAVNLSGGVDSVAMLLGLLRLGRRPRRVYTYCYKGYDSEDAAAASKVARQFKIPHVVVVIPTDEASVIGTVKDMLARGVRGKATTQVMHGQWYLAPMVKEKLVFDGTCADTMWGSFRGFAILCKDDKPLFDRMRLNEIRKFAADNYIVCQQELFARHGVKIYYPYWDKDLMAYFLTKSWRQLNTPRLKQALVKHFPEFKKHSFYRGRGSAQVVAGARDLHYKVLAAPQNIPVQRAYKLLMSYEAKKDGEPGLF